MSELSTSLSYEVIPGIWAHRCLRCYYTWTGRMKNPKTCAGCNSPYWNEEKTIHKDKKARKLGKKSDWQFDFDVEL